MSNLTPAQIKENKVLLKKNLSSMKDMIVEALPSHIKPEVMISMALSCVTDNPKLLACTRPSILKAVLTASQLGLTPGNNLGLCYFIPYGATAQFQLGYKGMIQLIRRTGKVAGIVVEPVYKQDNFDYDLAHGIRRHERTQETSYDDADITHFYCIIKYKDGGMEEKVMTKKEVDIHKARYSKTYNRSDSPWNTNYVSMGKKTVIIQAAKYAELSTEINQAVSLEEATENQMKQKGWSSMIDHDKVTDEMKAEAEEEYYAEIVEEEENNKKSQAEEAKEKTKAKADRAVQQTIDGA